MVNGLLTPRNRERFWTIAQSDLNLSPLQSQSWFICAADEPSGGPIATALMGTAIGPADFRMAMCRS